MPSNTAYASSNPIEISMPVEQSFEIHGSSSAAVDQKGLYELSANSSSSPMPDKSEENKYIFTIDGTDHLDIAVSDDKTGIYDYTVKQITKDKSGYKYDRSIYKVTIYIQNREANSLVPQIIVQNESGEKTGEIMFRNSYRRTGGGGGGNSDDDESKKEEEESDSSFSISEETEIKTPDTVDTGSIALWIILAAISLTAMGVLSYMQRRTRR